MYRRRGAVEARQYGVATPHWAATDAAVEALHNGGNSVDAALAASAVLSVVYPHMCGLGGDVFAVVAGPDTRVVVNGSGPAARLVDPEAVRRMYGSMPQEGPLTVTVPGAVAAWATLAAEFGGLPLAAAIAPAIAAAEKGTAVARSLARAIAANKVRVDADPGMKAVLSHGGFPLVEGDPLVQPALGQSLRAIADEGSAAFYDGPIADALVPNLSAMGSPLTQRDFREYRVEVGSPLSGLYRQWEVLVPPPNSQGFVLLEILGCLQRVGGSGVDLDRWSWALGQFFLLATADRDRFLADPRRVRVPVEALLSLDHLEDLIRQAQAAVDPTTPTSALAGDTVGVVVAQEGGMWISMNFSIYRAFGSGILDPDTGLILQNRGASFSVDPDAANYLAGGVRPAHTLMPVVVLEGSEPRVASATMGGSAHAQIHAQILTRMLEGGLPAREAVDHPRWLVGGLQVGGGPAVVAESRVGEDVTRALQDSGMQVEPLKPWDEQVGHAQVVSRRPDGGLEAASDPRADGTAATG